MQSVSMYIQKNKTIRRHKNPMFLGHRTEKGNSFCKLVVHTLYFAVSQIWD